MSTAVREGTAGRRALGAYYTPPDAARSMAAWLLRAGCRRVLEPSAGDGVFLDALTEVAGDVADGDLSVTAVELDSDALRRTTARARPGIALSTVNADFLSVETAPHDAVMGNPPYVRLRHLAPTARRQALATAERSLGAPMDPGGSVWMPFVLHATHSLRPGGRMALVLPYECTYVRYARPLWRFLGAHFGSLRVVRTYERLFPDILQEVVLLLAAGKGGATQTVDLEVHESVAELDPAAPAAHLDLDEIVDGRPFVEALLPAPLRALLRGPIAAATRPARDLATFRIGYVSGDKQFFQPPDEAVAAFGLPAGHLRPALGSARWLRGQGLRTSGLDAAATARLYRPDPQELTPADERYLAHGAETGVSDRYKCRIRRPWYVVPHVDPPDVALTVFAETPLLLVNDAACAASNSFLCGYTDDADAFARQWYTSLTLLSLELRVHALGGGVFVLVPREVGQMRLADPRLVASCDLGAVNAALRAGDVPAAYRVGDASLVASGAMTGDDLELVRAGADELARWRRARQAGAASATGRP